jgi:type III pantothenate kinase
MRSEEKILTIDIGNSFTHCGLFQNKTLILEMRWPTRQALERRKEIFLYLQREAEGIILASVVPEKERELKDFIKRNFSGILLSLSDGLETGLEIEYAGESPLGEDRIASLSAVVFHYRKDGIVIDLGTATTISSVTRRGKFLGGVIAPGIASSLSFLRKARRLKAFSSRFLHPATPARKIPPPYLAKSTEAGLRNGIYLFIQSYLGGMVGRLKRELAPKRFTTFLTGGFSFLYGNVLKGIDIIDPFLTLRGLCEIYHLNRRR